MLRTPSARIIDEVALTITDDTRAGTCPTVGPLPCISVDLNSDGDDPRRGARGSRPGPRRAPPRLDRRPRGRHGEACGSPVREPHLLGGLHPARVTGLSEPRS